MDYKNLIAWQQSIELTKNIYALIKDFPPEEKYAISDQMRRAVVSIPSNIAEGCGRQTKKEAKHFFYIAQGSLYELDTQLLICQELGYMDDLHAWKLFDLTDYIHRMLVKLINRYDD